VALKFRPQGRPLDERTAVAFQLGLVVEFFPIISDDRRVEPGRLRGETPAV